MIFYYYGAVIPLAEVTSLMVQYGEKDPYCFILDHGLQYRKVGKINDTFQVVIGKELSIRDDNIYELNQDNTSHEILSISKDLRLTRKDEQDIINKLLLIGCYFTPKYFAIMNY